MSSPCLYFNQNRCRSCIWINLPIATQITQKERLLANALGTLMPKETLTTVSGPELGFRNKAKLVVTGTLENPVLGILNAHDKDSGVEILDCPVHHPRLNEVLHGLKDFISLAKIEPYQISTQRGELKGIICFYSEHSQEMYIRFVLRSKEAISRIEKYAPSLLERYPFITSLSGNIQPIPHAILEGPEEIGIAGKGTVTHALNRAGSSDQVELEINPRAFVQTNQEVAEHLYQTAADWIGALKVRKFTELFCGQGAFSFFAKDSIEDGLGIEVNGDAVKAATATAIGMNARHLKFIAADAGSVESVLTHFNPDLVLVNPPRKGLGQALSILQRKTYPHLIYSSCSYASLASDLKSLNGYEIEKLQIFDLFPHTEHFEILVLLRPKSTN